MKKDIFLFLIFFVGFTSFAQDEIRAFVQQKATPKEGLVEFYKVFAAEFAFKDLPTGTEEVNVQLKFVVEKDGSFSNIEIRGDKQEVVGNEAVRVLKTMPKWQPARHNGEIVRSALMLPIRIRPKANQNDSDEKILKTDKEIRSYVESLATYRMNTPYFDFDCNCGLFKSSKNDVYQTEEFFFETVDKRVYYNVVLRKIKKDDVKNQFEEIKKDLKQQNGTFKEFVFHRKDALETSLTVPDGDYVNEYRTVFFNKDEYFIALNIVSYNKQLAELTMEHLKQTFKLKL